MKAQLLTKLKLLIAKHAQADGKPNKMLPSITVAKAEASTLPQLYVALPVFSLVVQGSKRIGIDRKVFDYGVGQFLVTSIDLPLNVLIRNATRANPFLGLSLALKPTAIANLLLEAGSARTHPSNMPGIAVSTLTDDLIDPVIRLLSLLDRPADIPVLAPGIEREILWRLINGPQGEIVKQLGLADSRISQVGTIIRWIRDHYSETIRIEKLAGMAGMSVTSFHRNFRSVTSMTPIQYQKQIRLQEARARLTATGDDVATIAFSVGYDSPSQFSREYRRQFGISPSKHAHTGARKKTR